MRTKKKRQHGFTFIELILYISLVSIFISTAVLSAWNIIYGRARSSVHQNLNHNLRFATKRIAFEIRNASSINSLTETSISLSMNDPARNPTVINLVAGRVRMGFGSSGVCPTTSPCFLTSNDISITNFIFTDLSDGDSTNIRISITGQTSGSRPEYQRSQTIQTSSELRTD